MLRLTARLVPLVVLGSLVLAVGPGAASTPPSSSVTVPSTAGQTVRDQPEWGGTALPGANPESDCTPGLPTAPNDEHSIAVTVPPGVYDTIDATFKFEITWTPATPAGISAHDLILTVVGPDGNDIDSSDGGSNVETVTALNLPGGTYKMVVCSFANPTLQPYSGKLEITTSARVVEADLPAAPSQGLAFSASVASDNQRDQSEPLIEIDKAGFAYDCGPTGFSNAAEYAGVSRPSEHGDQFHLLGTPPRGQMAGGGGGDCGLAFGITPNVLGNHQVAYTGLGPLTGFATATSSRNGQTFATAGPAGNGLPGGTTQGVLADRQWMTFTDAQTVLLSYNQQQPRNVVIQKSTNGGLTYDPTAVRAARNPRFPGPMRYIEPSSTFPQGVVYFPVERGNQINLSISQDRGATWTNCGLTTTPGTATLFATADHDTAGNIYVVYGENLKFHTYMVTLAADKITSCNQSVNATANQPTLLPDADVGGPVQVDRNAIRSTVFQWVTAGGEPGRVAVVFAGTNTDGNPNSGDFKATWHIYANQSLNALAPDATFSQVRVTTHPFHYDSICLNGLGCDLSVPPGDRSMADFFSLDFNPNDNRIYVTYNRANKKPDEDVGHVATPMVATQIAGPTLSGNPIEGTTRPVLRSSTDDPTGDALSSYSLMGVGVEPPPPPTTNEPAGDFESVSIGPELDLLDNTEVKNGGFTVTMKVTDLSPLALQQTALRTQSQSLLWIWRFTNGYQDAAAAARWNPAQGFTFGFNDYATGAAPCQSPAGSGEKCILYPGDQPIEGDVNQTTGTIRFSVPRHLLRGLSTPDDVGNGQRPSEVPAGVGTRFYDGTAFSLGNSVSPIQTLQSFLYPLDNSPSMDFLLPAGGGGPTTVPCKITGSGTLATTGGKFSLNVHVGTPPKGSVSYRDSSTDFRSTSLTKAECSSPSNAHIEGSGRDGNNTVSFTLDVVDGGEASTSDVFTLAMDPGGTRSGTLSKGNIQVHKN